MFAESIAVDLSAALDGAAVTGEPRTDLRALLSTARNFAHHRPEGYALLYARLPERARPDREVLADASAVVLRAAAALAGEEQALAAARTLVSWLHGFVSMELAGAFRLGGDVEAAFNYGAGHLVDAIAAPRGR